MKTTTNDVAEIFIYGDIVSYEWDESDTSAAGFRDDLQQLEAVKTINLHINSPGGSVFEGIAIYNMLKQFPATINTYVDGLAASIASVIAMAGDVIYMPENTMLMIHNPWSVVQGNADELRKQADELDRVADLSVTTYLNKANGKIVEDNLKQLLAAETWLSAKEAVELGLADEILEPNQMAASISDDFQRLYKNVPQDLIKKESSTSQLRQQMIVDAKKSNDKILKYFGGK